MSAPSEMEWDLAGQLVVKVEGLDVAQCNAVHAQLDPIRPAGSTRAADVILGSLPPVQLTEMQGPANDRRMTAVDVDGRLLARFGEHWMEVPPPNGDPVRINLQAGLRLGSCWGDVVRPGMHQALRNRGCVAVHAAAVDGGVVGGTLLCGWSESGKTEVALALVEAGADFLSDKWTVAGQDGHISTFPIGVGVRGWVMQALPRLQAALPTRARAQLAASRLVRAAASPILNYKGGRLATLATNTILHAVELGDRAGLSPTDLRRAYGQAGDPARRSKLETVVVLVTGPTEQVLVEDVTPEWAARRLARTAAYERRNYYNLQERGAYAGLPNRAGARDVMVAEEEPLLSRAFAGAARVVRVTCPFPGDPRRVVDALATHQ